MKNFHAPESGHEAGGEATDAETRTPKQGGKAESRRDGGGL